MKIYSARELDPVTYVFSAHKGYYWYCPTVAHVDAHLAELLGSLRPVCNLTEAGRRYAWDDVDALLERRQFLMEVGEAPTRQELGNLSAHDRRMIA